jgi:hypothetical protein
VISFSEVALFEDITPGWVTCLSCLSVPISSIRPRPPRTLNQITCHQIQDRGKIGREDVELLPTSWNVKVDSVEAKWMRQNFQQTLENLGMILVALVGLCAGRAADAPQVLPAPDQAVILWRESEARIVFRDTGLPMDRGRDGDTSWALVPATPLVIGIDLVFLGSGSSIAGVPVPVVGGTTYRLVVAPHPPTNPFGTHYVWFENANTGVCVSYRFAILPPGR